MREDARLTAVLCKFAFAPFWNTTYTRTHTLSLSLFRDENDEYFVTRKRFLVRATHVHDARNRALLRSFLRSFMPGG